MTGNLRFGIPLMFVTTILWGVNWPVMKMAVAEIPVLTVRTVCLGIGGPLMLLFASSSGQSLRLPTNRVFPVLLSAALNITAWHLLSAYGTTLLQAGRGAIIAYTMPVWATLLGAVLLGERITLRKTVGILLGLAGLAVLIVPGFAALADAPLGMLVILAAAVAWAGGTVANKYWDWGMPATTLLGWQMLLGGLPVFIAQLVFPPQTPLSDVSLQGWLALTYLVLATTVFCHWAYLKAVLMFPASIAAFSLLATPVVGVVSSSLMLGEPIGLPELLSLLLIALALAVILLPGRKPR